MTTLAILHATLLREPQPVADIAILVEDGIITKLGLADDFDVPADATVVDGSGFLLSAGFCDLQVNGGFGHDFTHNPRSIWTVATQLTRFGVTSFLPTIITSPLETIEHAQYVIQDRPKNFRGALPLGLHVEGPYLNPAKKGAHNSCFLRQPDLAEIEDWSAENGIRLVTLAPELDGAEAIIGRLRHNGIVVSAGHSMATFAQTKHSFDVGIRYGTHLFNAMPPLHHREIGLVGALLTDERVTIGLIPDGVHVDPALVNLVWQIAGSRINVVTDCMTAMGMPDGTYNLADRTVTVADGRSFLPDGTLAGSVVTLDQALRNIVAWCHCTTTQAIATVTTTPANLLGETTRGTVAVGNIADLVLLTPQLDVVMTIAEGNIVYNSEKSSRKGAKTQSYQRENS